MKTSIIMLIISLFIYTNNSIAELTSSEFNELFLGIVKAEKPDAKLKLVEDTLTKCDETQRFAVLPQAAKIAFNAGKKEKAANYAQELLELAKKYPSDWNYGNAIHDGNMILGRLALANGQLEKAKSYLIEAGKTPGSPQLDTFGPNMTLAKDLLEIGEKEIVIEYFELCRKFWELENGRLDSWSASIKGGGVPYFEANLLY
jgi:tetratricopeptide (TPR) repeat protein